MFLANDFCFNAFTSQQIDRKDTVLINFRLLFLITLTYFVMCLHTNQFYFGSYDNHYATKQVLVRMF